MGSICNLTFIATHFGIVATFQPPTAPYPLYLNVLFVKIRKSRDKGKARESCNLISFRHTSNSFKRIHELFRFVVAVKVLLISDKIVESIEKFKNRLEILVSPLLLSKYIILYDHILLPIRVEIRMETGRANVSNLRPTPHPPGSRNK